MYKRGMPATRHKHSKCGHRGFGADCARCLQAEKLEKEEEKLKDGPKKAALKAEAARLRGPQTRKGRRGPAAIDSSVTG